MPPHGLDTDALLFYLVKKAVQHVQLLLCEGLAGKIGLPDAGQFLFDEDHGSEIPQGNGDTIHLRDAAHIRLRVIQKLHDLIQCHAHTVQQDALVHVQVALLVKES